MIIFQKVVNQSNNKGMKLVNNTHHKIFLKINPLEFNNKISLLNLTKSINSKYNRHNKIWRSKKMLYKKTKLYLVLLVVIQKEMNMKCYLVCRMWVFQKKLSIQVTVIQYILLIIFTKFSIQNKRKIRNYKKTNNK